MLSWKHEVQSPKSLVPQTNGNALEQHKHNAASSDYRAQPVNEIREATRAAMHVISRTVQTARQIFQAEGSQPSLIRHVLEYIQSDSPSFPDQPHASPEELYLSTQSLLAELPSSSHFQLLPPNLRSYRPHVDLTSPHSLIHQPQFRRKLDEWFRQSTANLQPAVKRWFAELQSVKAIWSVRSSAKGWISTSGLGPEELLQTTDLLDEVCRHRTIEIWKLKLDETLKSFGDQLDSKILSLNQGSEAQRKGKSFAFRTTRAN